LTCNREFFIKENSHVQQECSSYLNSSVGIVASCKLNGRGSIIGKGDFSLHSVQADPGAHPASYTISNGVKLTIHIHRISSLKCLETLTMPPPPSWRGAYFIKHRDYFSLPLPYIWIRDRFRSLQVFLLAQNYMHMFRQSVSLLRFKPFVQAGKYMIHAILEVVNILM
jgi:hypothetical protein